MENTDVRARVAEVAAPPGGWPNLAGDLAEVRFFLKQGQLDEAYDLLSILQRRYPGHPELADFARSADAAPRPDADVENLVDSVLADSAALGGRLPRRRATPWDAPESQPVQRRGRKLTTAHEVVRAALIEDVEDAETNPQGKVVVADYAMTPRPARKPVPKVDHTRAFAAVPPKRIPKVRLRPPGGGMPQPKLLRDASTAEAGASDAVESATEPKARERVDMPPTRADDSPQPVSPQATTKKEAAANPDPAVPPKTKATPLRTVAVDSLQPAAPYEAPTKAAATSNTVVVDALQPPAPFAGEGPELFEARKEQIKRATNKTGRRRRVTGVNDEAGSAKSKRPRGVPPRRDGDKPRKPRATAFGAGVLSRFGR